MLWWCREILSCHWLKYWHIVKDSSVLVTRTMFPRGLKIAKTGKNSKQSQTQTSHTKIAQAFSKLAIWLVGFMQFHSIQFLPISRSKTDNIYTFGSLFFIQSSWWCIQISVYLSVDRSLFHQQESDNKWSKYLILCSPVIQVWRNDDSIFIFG